MVPYRRNSPWSPAGRAAAGLFAGAVAAMAVDRPGQKPEPQGQHIHRAGVAPNVIKFAKRPSTTAIPLLLAIISLAAAGCQRPSPTREADAPPAPMAESTPAPTPAPPAAPPEQTPPAPEQTPAATPTPEPTASPTPAPTPVSEDVGEVPDLTPSAEPFQPADIVVELNGRTLNGMQLQMATALRPLPRLRINPWRDLPRLRGVALAHVAREVGAYDGLAAAAKARGLTLSDEQMTRLDNIIAQYAEAMLYTEHVVSRIGEAPEDALRALYEQHKAERYAVREEMRMRHIFTSTYIDHVVAEGETLESIAVAVAGDESVAPLILSDETKRPRVEGLPEVEEGARRLAPRPLIVGERLKVPARGAKEAAARERIEAALAELAAGRSFEEVAAEYSENERRGELWIIRPDEQDRPIMPELLAAFMQLEDGAYSQPLRTKHGFQVIQRVSYRPAGFTPFEQVRNSLADEWRSAETARLRKQFMLMVLGDPDVVTLHADRLNAEVAAPADVLLTIGERDYTREELTQALRDQFSATLTPDEFLSVLADSRVIAGELVRSYVTAKGLRETPDARLMAELASDSMLAINYLDALATEEITISDEEVAAYYAANEGSFREPESFELYAARNMAAAATDSAPDTISQLAVRSQGITTLDEFKRMAGEVNLATDRGVGPGGSMGRVPIQRLTPEELTAIRKVTPPGLTEPFIARGMANVYWVDAVHPERLAPLDEVRPRIEDALRREKGEALREQQLKLARPNVTVRVLIEKP